MRWRKKDVISEAGTLHFHVMGKYSKPDRVKTMGTRWKINAIWWNIKINLQILIDIYGYELPTNLQNFTQKDLTEVKIFQKVLGGGGYYFLKHPLMTYCLMSLMKWLLEFQLLCQHYIITEPTNLSTTAGVPITMSTLHLNRTHQSLNDCWSSNYYDNTTS